VNAFKDGLRQLGYVDGQNLAFEYRWAHGQSGRLPELAAELIRLKVSIIATGNSPSVVAAMKATTTIPIVSIGPDLLSIGLVSSLARPSGNVTGVSLVPGPEIGGKHLELLKEAVPNVSRVAVLMHPEHPGHPAVVKAVEAAARAARLPIQVVRAGTAHELDTAFSAMARGKADGRVVLSDPDAGGSRDRMTRPRSLSLSR
jgi:putative ABC transport system substrate-binding protein